MSFLNPITMFYVLTAYLGVQAAMSLLIVLGPAQTGNRLNLLMCIGEIVLLTFCVLTIKGGFV